jgi:hypothetical protein
LAPFDEVDACCSSGPECTCADKLELMDMCWSRLDDGSRVIPLHPTSWPRWIRISVGRSLQCMHEAYHVCAVLLRTVYNLGVRSVSQVLIFTRSSPCLSELDPPRDTHEQVFSWSTLSNHRLVRVRPLPISALQCFPLSRNLRDHFRNSSNLRIGLRYN